MNTEITPSKGDLPEANSQLNGMWEEIVRRYNMHDELVKALNRLYNRAKVYGAFADTDDYNGRALQAAKEILDKEKNDLNS